MTLRRPALAFTDAMDEAAEEGRDRLAGVSRCHSTWHTSLVLAAMYAASVSPCISWACGTRHWRGPLPGSACLYCGLTWERVACGNGGLPVIRCMGDGRGGIQMPCRRNAPACEKMREDADCCPKYRYKSPPVAASGPPCSRRRDLRQVGIRLPKNLPTTAAICATAVAQASSSRTGPDLLHDRSDGFFFLRGRGRGGHGDGGSGPWWQPA